MKLSKPLSALILIASALLLNAGKSPAQNSGRPSQGLPQQRNNAPQGNQSYSGEWTGTWTANPDNGKPSAKESGENSNQNTSPLWKIWEWITGISAQGFFNLITAVATGAIAWYTVRLTGVTNEMKEATKAAAAAAEASLHIYRPFLLVTGVECADVKVVNGMLIHKFTIRLKNFGVGPADIVTYVAGADPHDTPIGIVTQIKEPDIRYVPERGNRLSDSVIGPGERVDDRIECRSVLDPALWALLRDGTKTLAVNGIIIYRGTAPKDYETKFFWWFFVDADGRPIRSFRAFRPDLNSHT
jgi:hypothetical protein